MSRARLSLVIILASIAAIFALFEIRVFLLSPKNIVLKIIERKVDWNDFGIATDGPTTIEIQKNSSQTDSSVTLTGSLLERSDFQKLAIQDFEASEISGNFNVKGRVASARLDRNRIVIFEFGGHDYLIKDGNAKPAGIASFPEGFVFKNMVSHEGSITLMLFDLKLKNYILADLKQDGTVANQRLAQVFPDNLKILLPHKGGFLLLGSTEGSTVRLLSDGRRDPDFELTPPIDRSYHSGNITGAVALIDGRFAIEVSEALRSSKPNEGQKSIRVVRSSEPFVRVVRVFDSKGHFVSQLPELLTRRELAASDSLGLAFQQALKIPDQGGLLAGLFETYKSFVTLADEGSNSFSSLGTLDGKSFAVKDALGCVFRLVNNRWEKFTTLCELAKNSEQSGIGFNSGFLEDSGFFWSQYARSEKATTLTPAAFIYLNGTIKKIPLDNSRLKCGPGFTFVQAISINGDHALVGNSGCINRAPTNRRLRGFNESIISIMGGHKEETLDTPLALEFDQDWNFKKVSPQPPHHCGKTGGLIGSPDHLKVLDAWCSSDGSILVLEPINKLVQNGLTNFKLNYAQSMDQIKSRQQINLHFPTIAGRVPSSITRQPQFVGNLKGDLLAIYSYPYVFLKKAKQNDWSSGIDLTLDDTELLKGSPQLTIDKSTLLLSGATWQTSKYIGQSIFKFVNLGVSFPLLILQYWISPARQLLDTDVSDPLSLGLIKKFWDREIKELRRSQKRKMDLTMQLFDKTGQFESRLTFQIANELNSRLPENLNIKNCFLGPFFERVTPYLFVECSDTTEKIVRFDSKGRIEAIYDVPQRSKVKLTMQIGEIKEEKGIILFLARMKENYSEVVLAEVNLKESQIEVFRPIRRSIYSVD